MREIKWRYYFKNQDGEYLKIELTMEQVEGAKDGAITQFKQNFYGCELVARCQFTDLCDNNGKEIFEGDIIKTIANGRELTGPVYYEDAQWFGGRDYLGYAVAYSGAEVIGNIWENPELLEP